MTIYGRSEELVSRCVECDLAEPESLASLGGSAPGLVDGILSRWFWVMLKQRVPNRLWDYGIRWVCNIIQCTASNSGHLHGRTPLEQLTGETPDISEYLDFSFFD